MSDQQAVSFAARASGPDDWPMLAGPAPVNLWVPLSPRLTALTANPREPGTRVVAGEALTDASVDAAHRAIAPLPGTVGQVAEVSLPGRQRVWAIELRVDSDAAGTAPPNNPSPDSTADVSAPPSMSSLAASERGQWIDRLRRAGVWADRIASPDLISQLHQSLRRPIDTVICNLLDSDRESPINESLARRWPRELVEGIALLARIAGATRIWAATPTGHMAAFATATTMGRRAGVRFITLPNEYPLADPTLLLYRLLKRRLRPRRLPVEQGVVLFDAPAAIAAGRLALSGQSMSHVPLAVHDHIRNRSHRITVAVGTPLRSVLSQLQCIGAEKGLIEVRAGALLRELRIDDLLLSSDVARPLVVGGSELSLHVSLPGRAVNPDPCIRCSWCVEGCPTRIHPAGLLEAAQRRDLVLAERYGIEACIECGVCSYVCPSHLPLLSGIRALRRDADAANLGSSAGDASS